MHREILGKSSKDGRLTVHVLLHAHACAYHNTFLSTISATRYATGPSRAAPCT